MYIMIVETKKDSYTTFSDPNMAFYQPDPVDQNIWDGNFTVGGFING